MEEILTLLSALVVWRIIAGSLSAGVIAYALSQSFEAFTAGYCVTLFFAGLLFGVVWHSRAEQVAAERSVAHRDCQNEAAQ